jgi:hypothetical protein
LGQEEFVPAIALFSSTKTGVLPHGPVPIPVHVRVDAPGEWKLTGLLEHREGLGARNLTGAHERCNAEDKHHGTEQQADDEANRILGIGVAVEVNSFKQSRHAKGQEQDANHLVPNDSRRLYDLWNNVPGKPVRVWSDSFRDLPRLRKFHYYLMLTHSPKRAL